MPQREREYYSGEMAPKKIKVLVVEDDRKWLSDYKENLRKQGIKDILTAEKAETAIKLIGEKNPNWVITDGLYGGWTDIAELGQKLGIPVILISQVDPERVEDIRKSAARRGARFINKDDIDFSEEGLVKFYTGLAQEIMESGGGSKEAPAF